MKRDRVPVRIRGALADLLVEERGAVTAEFALVVPAALIVLALVLGGLGLSAERVALTGLAGDLARLEARGDHAIANERLAGFGSSPRIERERRGELLCLTAASTSLPGPLAALVGVGSGGPFAVSATACAALSGVR